MTPQPPRELLVPERPVRSDYGREKSYARRRLATVAVVVLVLGGVAYGLLGRHVRDAADIPTIQAEGPVKQKPADPGGIDIPHQDVQVYDELEGKNAPQPQIEHLLPAPEVPQNVPHAPASGSAMEAAAPSPPAQDLSAEPLAPPAAAKNDIILGENAPPPIATTVGLAPAAPEPVAPPVVAPAPTPAPVAAVKKAAPVQVATGAPQSLTIDQVIKQSQPPAPPPAAPSVETFPADASPAPASAPSHVASGSFAIQLAASTDPSKAEAMKKDLQQKYAAQLRGVTLRLATADLGSRGTFYRIQSQGLAEGDANQICSALKQRNAGCIVVRR